MIVTNGKRWMLGGAAAGMGFLTWSFSASRI
jgi:hypothetical protein